MYGLLKDGKMTSPLSKFQTIRLCNSENCYMPFENAHHPIKNFTLDLKQPPLSHLPLGNLRLQLPMSRASPSPSKELKSPLTDLVHHSTVYLLSNP